MGRGGGRERERESGREGGGEGEGNGVTSESPGRGVGLMSDGGAVIARGLLHVPRLLALVLRSSYTH